MKTLLVLCFVAIASTTLAIPLETDSKHGQQQKRALHARQTDNFMQAVAGPPGFTELAWLLGSLVIAWALIAIGILALRKRRNQFIATRETIQERWEETYQSMVP